MSNAGYMKSFEDLVAAAEQYDKDRASQGNSFRVQAAPGLQFEPKKLEDNKNVKWVGVDDDGNEVIDDPMEEGAVLSSRTGKTLGYCPKCASMVCTYDLETKFIYICGGCGKRARTKTLKEESAILNKKQDEWKNKKEYMASSINANHLDSPVVISSLPSVKGDV